MALHKMFVIQLLGVSATSPLHQYNLDVGEDDVFMVSLTFLAILLRNPPKKVKTNMTGIQPVSKAVEHSFWVSKQ